MKPFRGFTSLGLILLLVIGLAVLGGVGWYITHLTGSPYPPQGNIASTTPTSVGQTGYSGAFSHNQPVTIQGYSGNAEEPYLTPDGQYLIFDDRTSGDNIAKIYYAKRVNDSTFTFMGEVKGVNASSPSIMAVMDDNDTFYFNSPRAPDMNSAIYRGLWHSDGTVTGVARVPGLAAKAEQTSKGIAGVSRDGKTLYLGFCDTSRSGSYTNAAGNNCGSVGIALKNPDGTFTELDDGSSDSRLLDWENEFKNIYGMFYGGQYGSKFSGAMMMTPDGLEAYFEQINSSTGVFPPQLNQIYVAKRSSTSEPFGTPQLVAGQATLSDGTVGFNEGTFVSRDGKLLYYHHVDLVRGQDPRKAHYNLHVMSR